MLMVTLVPQQASNAVGGVNVQGVPGVIVMFDAQVITGGVVSTIVTVWAQVAEVLLQQSVACHLRVTIVKHLENTLVNVACMVMVTLVPQQASNAVGASNVQGVPHCTVLLGGQLRTGGVVSMILTTSTQVEVFVQQSCACQ